MPITPQQLAKAGREHDHQVAVFQWVAISGVKRHPDMALLYAIPNGAKLKGIGTDEGRAEGGRMKAEGVRSGVPDMMLPVPRVLSAQNRPYHVSCPGWYPGLYVELKKPGREREKDGGRSPEQVDWQRKLLRQGYAVVTAYGWQAAAWTLADYFAGKLVMPVGGDCMFGLARENAPWD
jgi:hypothetical protein